MSKTTAAVGLVALFIGVGCSAPVVRPPVATYTPHYQFESPKTEIPGSAKSTIAIVTYKQNQADNLSNEFNDRFVKDLQNVLVARGYSVKGPFASKDELTFSDKKGSDFILTYGIAFTNEYSNVQITEKANISQLPQTECDLLWDGTFSNLPIIGVTKNYTKGTAYYFKGEIKNTAKINLTLVESMSGEKMLSKTLDISAEPEAFETNVPHAAIYGTVPAASIRQTKVADIGMQNARFKTADKIYTNAFTSIWKSLDPEELREIKKQSDEIKSKKVY